MKIADLGRFGASINKFETSASWQTWGFKIWINYIGRDNTFKVFYADDCSDYNGMKTFGNMLEACEFIRSECRRYALEDFSLRTNMREFENFLKRKRFDIDNSVNGR